MRSIYPYILICLLFTGCKKSEITPPQNDLNLLLQKINSLRQSGCNCGTEFMPPVAPLSSNTLLDNAATAHAIDMVQRSYFDHVSPDGNTPEERAKLAGYTGNVKAENLGKGYVNSDQVISAWKNSISHCKVMMDPNSKEAGVGFNRNYWVAVFGNPL